MAAGDITVAAPEVIGARASSHLVNGQEIGPWVNNFEPDFEDNIVEFEGQGNTPTAAIDDGYTYTASATVADHPTIMGVLEPLYFTRPKTHATWVWTKGDGRTMTMDFTVSHLAYSASSGEVLTVEVDLRIHSLQLG